MAMSVLQLVYISAASKPIDPPQLAELLARARRKNMALGVTGVLVHDGGSFLQVLEGAETVVETLFRVIESDPRHRRVIVLGRQLVAQPAFGNWQMGFVDRAHPELKALPGFKDLSGAAFDPATLTDVKSRAYYLLEAFSVGRFRQFVAD